MGFPIRKSPATNACCQLTEAYRRLLRPSSPPDAKAFTLCTSILDHITLIIIRTTCCLIFSRIQNARFSRFVNQIVKDLSPQRSPFKAMFVFLKNSFKDGGAKRDRTADLLRARQALSQLSYSPEYWWVWVDSNHRPHPYQGCALTS